MKKQIWLGAFSLLALGACRQATSSSNELGNAADENTVSSTSSNQTAATAETRPIDGTWKADISSYQVDQGPDEYLIQAGQFSCKSCNPPFTIPADGGTHPVSLFHADRMAVEVHPDELKITTRKGPAHVDTSTTFLKVEPDGNTMLGTMIDSSISGAPPSRISFSKSRVGPAPAGSHPASGKWQLKKITYVNPEALTAIYSVTGNDVTFSSPSGYSYEAKLDGPAVPIKGDIDGATVAVTKTGGSYVETRQRDGKVVSVTTFSVEADRKMHVVQEDKLSGSKISWTAAPS